MLRREIYVAPNNGPRLSGGHLKVRQHISAENTYPRKCCIQHFLGFTLYCTQNRKGNFKVGLRTEKSRLQRSLSRLREHMRRIRHLPIPVQVFFLNRVLRGHYAYYGIAGNIRSLQKVHRFVERYWHKMLCSRSRKGYIRWEVFQRIKARFPLQRPKLRLPYRELQLLAVL